jgi:hypothetical protein
MCPIVACRPNEAPPVTGRDYVVCFRTKSEPLCGVPLLSRLHDRGAVAYHLRCAAPEAVGNRNGWCSWCCDYGKQQIRTQRLPPGCSPDSSCNFDRLHRGVSVRSHVQRTALCRGPVVTPGYFTCFHCAQRQPLAVGRRNRRHSVRRERVVVILLQLQLLHTQTVRFVLRWQLEYHPACSLGIDACRRLKTREEMDAECEAATRQETGNLRLQLGYTGVNNRLPQKSARLCVPPVSLALFRLSVCF